VIPAAILFMQGQSVPGCPYYVHEAEKNLTKRTALLVYLECVTMDFLFEMADIGRNLADIFYNFL